ncbi:MAG: tripartite tricarboxylate transporter TctB family protein [Firmicutes bacterium]|nr:tripartite tricarboxylate transporter TctB family protein [Bacillota bacterium]
MKSRAAEYWVIAILSFGALFFIKLAQNVSTITLPGGIGPRTFPLITFWAILILNACLLAPIIWEKVRAKKAARSEGEGQTKLIWRIVPYIPRQTLIVIIMCLLLVFLWRYLGFLVVSFLFVTGASLLLVSAEKRSIWRSLVLAGVYTMAIYLLFVYVFKIPLA